MNGASASTVVATIRMNPNRQRNTASGMSHRLPEPRRHKPPARSRIEPATAASTIARRCLLPRPPRRHLEVAVERLDRRHRRERTEVFAILDVAIEAIADVARMRRSQETAMAERPRPELRRAVHPADDAAGRELGGDSLDERG